MRILYFSQFYTPESIAGAFRAADHARYWKKQGNEVVVFTGWPNYPTRKLFPGYDMKFFEESQLDGIRVLRSKQHIGANTSLIKRAINDGSYLAYGLANCILNRKAIGTDYDVVLASSGTVFSASLGVWYAHSIHTPIVVEFRDLAFVQLTATGNNEESLKVKLLKHIEVGLAKAADEVVVVTNGLKESLVEQGIPAEKITVAMNGADLVERKKTSSNSLRLGYFGTIGISQDVEETINVFEDVRHKGIKQLNYKIIGEGAKRDEVAERVDNCSDGWVTLCHGMSKDLLEREYEEIDFSVASLFNNESFGGSLPSKLFQSIARGIPVLYVGPEGEMADFIRINNVGIALTGTRSENVSKLFEMFSCDSFSELLTSLERNAEDVAKRYTRKEMAARVLDVLKRAAARKV